MIRLYYLLVLFFLIQFGNGNAQNEELRSKCIIHIETGEGSNLKSGEGYFFTFELTKDKIYYSSVLVNKKLIGNASKIKLFFKRADGKPNDKPYILTIPNNKDYVIRDDDEKNRLVAIPFHNLKIKLEEADIKTNPVSITEDNLYAMKIPVDKTDIHKLQKI